MRFSHAALALVALASWCQAQPAEVVSDIRYNAVPGVDPDLLSLDVYRPAGPGPFPIVVFVHGGGWYTGDKVSAVHAKADWLTAQNVLFVSVNYRLSPVPIASPPSDRIVFPTHPEDVGRAVAFVIENAAMWDGDPSRLALMGHSAGAHLATLVALDAVYLADAGASSGAVGCVVSLDTNAYDIPHYLSLGPSAVQRALYENAFTDDPVTQMDASPITYAGASPETEVLLVRQSNAFRAATTARFRDALDGSGHRVTAYVAPLSHMGINERLGTSDVETYDAAVSDVLDRCLGLPTSTDAAPRSEGRAAPNPTSGNVRLALPAAALPYVITVVDVRGRVVLRQRDRDGSLDLIGLPPGAYLVVARSGDQVVRRRVTVTR